MATNDTLSGWVVSFMVNARDGDIVKMRYVSSGFWAGQAVGRIALIYPTTKMGPRLALLVYSTISIGLLAIVQFVPDLVGNALAFGLIGFFLG